MLQSGGVIEDEKEKRNYMIQIESWKYTKHEFIRYSWHKLQGSQESKQ